MISWKKGKQLICRYRLFKETLFWLFHIYLKKVQYYKFERVTSDLVYRFGHRFSMHRSSSSIYSDIHIFFIRIYVLNDARVSLKTTCYFHDQQMSLKQ